MKNYENMYKVMKEEVLEGLRKVFPETIIIEEITNIKNGKIFEGVTIRRKDKNIAPCFYFNNYFEDYVNGEYTSEEIVESIIRYYNQTIKHQENIEKIEFENFEAIKDKIIFKIVNSERNNQILKNCPSFSFLDLSVIFEIFIDINKEEDETGTVTITDQMLKFWNINIETLLEYASVNTPKLLKPTIHEVLSVVYKEANYDLSFDEMIEEINPEVEETLYCLRNDRDIHGFTSIIYPKVLEKIQKKLGNFYIIPSSVNEALILPDNEFVDVDNLKELIKSTNQTMVTETEFLSDNAYYYNSETKELILCQ